MTTILDPSQERAVQLICTARVCAVTGGPGTGKTTSLRVALDRLDHHGVRYELAAPTGKAAKRMQEATGRSARTLHRLLEYHPETGFRRHAERPLEADLVVVDEASMVDLPLGVALLAALDPSRTRLVWVGDANQLPPVGPGRLFGDLVDAGAVPVARLAHVHRAAARSWVCTQAPRVLRGQPLALEARDDFEFVPVADPRQLAAAVTRAVGNTGAQVLVPLRTRVGGAAELNRALQAALCPRRRDTPAAQIGPRGSAAEMRVGDRVIHTRNNYRLQVFNGELGQVAEVGTKPGEPFLTVSYPDRAPVDYSAADARALELAYALTVHRSQGSEFPCVVVVAHSAHTYMLTRQLFYTAITRAKKRVVIVGDERGIRAALRRRSSGRRHTAIVERMRGDEYGDVRENTVAV